jgi:hypothetical protein
MAFLDDKQIVIKKLLISYIFNSIFEIGISMSSYKNKFE